VNGPDFEIRASILDSLVELAAQVLESDQRGLGFEGTALAENSLERVLDQLAEMVSQDISASEYFQTASPRALGEEEGRDLLAAVDAWAGLASAVVARTYAPASPWRRNVAGWGKKATAALQRITKLLLTPLQVAATALGASSWSIGIGFPWGISISLSWP